MFLVKIFILFGVLNLKFESLFTNGFLVTNFKNLQQNEFFGRLESLLDFCIFDLKFSNEKNFVKKFANFDDISEDPQGILLGILIAESQLRDLKFKNPKVKEIYQKLKILEQQIRSENEIHRKFLKNPQNFFNLNFPIFYGNLIEISSPNFHSVNNFLNSINDEFNQPDGVNSDFCIDEIFENDCKVSEKCENIENMKRKSFGYPMTHK